jgi:hypothetical protein
MADISPATLPSDPRNAILGCYARPEKRSRRHPITPLSESSRMMFHPAPKARSSQWNGTYRLTQG